MRRKGGVEGWKIASGWRACDARWVVPFLCEDGPSCVGEDGSA